MTTVGPDDARFDGSRIEFVLCDLDGVVWLSHDPIPGAPEAIARLRASGRRLVFVTNNSASIVADQEAALERVGVPAQGDVVTSAQAGASLVEPGESVVVVGGRGVREALEARRADIVEHEHPDAVVVGLDREFGYERLRLASRAIHNGARLIATNTDPTFPTPDGLTPGAGSIVAAVATAGGVTPTVAGKPHGPMARIVAERCGSRFSADRALMVGDRWSTDGRFADVIGCRFAYVRSGVPVEADEAPPDRAIDLRDLAAVADLVLGER